MKSSTTKNIREILHQSALNRIVQRANELNLVNTKIRLLLPDFYRGLYRIRNLSDNLLVFDVPNATVRQGLLLQKPMLLNLIQQELPQVKDLDIRITPDFTISPILT